MNWILLSTLKGNNSHGKKNDLRLGVLLLPMTRCANIIKIRCVLHHFNIVFGDTLTYNDIPRGIVSGNITFMLCAGSQL